MKNKQSKIKVYLTEISKKIESELCLQEDGTLHYNKKGDILVRGETTKRDVLSIIWKYLCPFNENCSNEK